MNTSRTAAVAIYLLDHSRNVCGEQPNFVAIDTIAAQGDGCSLSCSSTIRTARSQTSGENLFVVGLVMAPSYLGVGASGKPGAVQSALRKEHNLHLGRAEQRRKKETQMKIEELRIKALQQRLVLVGRANRWTIWTLTGDFIASGLTLAEVETVLESHGTKPPYDPSSCGVC